jgi:hypothetical protein
MGKRITFPSKLILKLLSFFYRRILTREAILALKMNPKPMDMSSNPIAASNTTMFKAKSLT